MGLLENLSQNFKAFEFLESWDVKAVELHHDVNDTVSLGMRETEKVHILRRHSHQIDEIMRFRRLEEIAMTRSFSCKLSGTEIEVRVLGELLKVRVEAEET